MLNEITAIERKQNILISFLLFFSIEVLLEDSLIWITNIQLLKSSRWIKEEECWKNGLQLHFMNSNFRNMVMDVNLIPFMVFVLRAVWGIYSWCQECYTCTLA